MIMVFMLFWLPGVRVWVLRFCTAGTATSPSNISSISAAGGVARIRVWAGNLSVVLSIFVLLAPTHFNDRFYSRLASKNLQIQAENEADLTGLLGCLV